LYVAGGRSLSLRSLRIGTDKFCGAAPSSSIDGATAGAHGKEVSVALKKLRACRVIAAVLAIGLICFARPAGAQLSIIPKVRLKAGVFLSTDVSLNNAVGPTWLKVGADVSLPFGLPLLGGGMRAGIDYMANGSSNIIPVTLTTVIQPSLGLTSPVYVGAGIGLWTGHIKGAGTSSRFGFRLLGGIDLGPKTFLEVQYDFVDKLSGVRADGFSALIGFKF
jgi:hypothetical protein